ERVTPTTVVRQMTSAAIGGGGENKVTVETTGGTVAPNQEAPRSDAVVADVPAAAEAKPDPNELKPNVEADPNALPPLQQNNQLESGTSSSAATAAPAKTEEMADISSSKKKKKHGLLKLNPF
ncbi:MAG: hypothetical protein WCF68_07525, partial [Terriglobales bacterium]